MKLDDINIIPKYVDGKIVSVTVVTERPVAVYHHCRKHPQKFMDQLQNYSITAVSDKDGNLVGFDVKTSKPHERFICKKLAPNRNWLRLIPAKI